MFIPLLHARFFLETECQPGNLYLKPGAPTQLARLADTDAGDGEDLPGQKEAKTGMLPEAFREEMTFIFRRYTVTVILDDDGKPVFGCSPGKEPDRC